MAKNSRKTEYDNPSAAVSLLGILLIALGVLAILSVSGTMTGSIFDTFRNIMYGVAGGFNYGVSALVIWFGLMMIFSGRHVSRRPLLMCTVIYLCVIGIIALNSSIANRLNMAEPYVKGISTYNNEVRQLSMVDSNSFWNELVGAYCFGCARNEQTGFLGMLLAWPADKFLGRFFGSLVLGVLAIVSGMFMFHFDVYKAADRIRERTARSRENHRRRREQEMYLQEQQEAQQRREESERRRNATAFSRRRNQQMAEPVPQQQVQPTQVSMFPQGFVFPGMMPAGMVPAEGQPQEIYDEIIMPQNAAPLWQTMSNSAAVSQEQPTQPQQNTAEAV